MRQPVAGLHVHGPRVVRESRGPERLLGGVRRDDRGGVPGPVPAAAPPRQAQGDLAHPQVE